MVTKIIPWGGLLRDRVGETRPLNDVCQDGKKTTLDKERGTRMWDEKSDYLMVHTLGSLAEKKSFDVERVKNWHLQVEPEAFDQTNRAELKKYIFLYIILK